MIPFWQKKQKKTASQLKSPCLMVNSWMQNPGKLHRIKLLVELGISYTCLDLLLFVAELFFFFSLPSFILIIFLCSCSMFLLFNLPYLGFLKNQNNVELYSQDSKLISERVNFGLILQKILYNQFSYFDHKMSHNQPESTSPILTKKSQF